ncbi:MAG: hypothetical protein ACTHU0_27135 [Kofleriaceae bacterium]
MIGVHKTSITKMFASGASALVDQICTVLKIPPPMQETKDNDELEAEIRKLDPKDRAKVLRFIREFVID